MIYLDTVNFKISIKKKGSIFIVSIRCHDRKRILLLKIPSQMRIILRIRLLNHRGVYSMIRGGIEGRQNKLKTEWIRFLNLIQEKKEREWKILQKWSQEMIALVIRPRDWKIEIINCHTSSLSLFSPPFFLSFSLPPCMSLTFSFKQKAH